MSHAVTEEIPTPAPLSTIPPHSNNIVNFPILEPFVETRLIRVGATIRGTIITGWRHKK